MTRLQLILLVGIAGWSVGVHAASPSSVAGLLAVAVLALVLERWGPRRWFVLLRDVVGLVGAATVTWLDPAIAPTALAVVIATLVASGGSVLLLPLAVASVVQLAHAPRPVVPPGWAAAILGAFLVVALAVETFLTDAVGGRRGVRRRTGGTWRRWVVGPAAVAVLVGLAAGLPLASRPLEERPVTRIDQGRPVARTNAAGLSTTLDIGTLSRIDPDPRIAARLSFTGAPPLVPRMTYLRAQALSVCTIDGAMVRWSASRGDMRPLPALAPPSGEPLAWLTRDAGGGDAVWRPDGARWVALSSLRRDADGNWYRPTLGAERSTYAVTCGGLRSDDGGPAEAGTVEPCRRYPAELTHLPWARIEDRGWAVLPPLAAAEAIAEVLAQRCTYALEGLPDPEATSAGSLRQFLFAEDARLRIGHCQYFATATTLLLRRAGHAARCVVGFASEESDPAGITFRALHAHAWVEVVDAAGHWRRYDPTPSSGFLGRQALLAALDPAQLPVAPPPPPDVPRSSTVSEPPATGNLGLALSGLAVTALAVTGLFILRRSRPVWSTRRQRRLEREREELDGVARALGIRPTPRMTLTALVMALEQRTGVSLQAILAARLREYYGHGPTAPPWPLEQLKMAIKSRPAQAVRTPR